MVNGGWRVVGDGGHGGEGGVRMDDDGGWLMMVGDVW